MAAVPGVDAALHDPAAALDLDGEIVAAAEVERFTRRGHGTRPVRFAPWELPEAAVRGCPDQAGSGADGIDLRDRSAPLGPGEHQPGQALGSAVPPVGDRGGRW
ncbi:MAG: hypothetical protein U0Q07_13125 [Acidimicrobiales bacterium]